MSSVLVAVTVCDHQRAAIWRHDGQGHEWRIARLLLQRLQPEIHFQPYTLRFAVI